MTGPMSRTERSSEATLESLTDEEVKWVLAAIDSYMPEHHDVMASSRWLRGVLQTARAKIEEDR